MSKSTKTLILAGFLCACMMTGSVDVFAADTDNKTTVKKESTATKRKTANLSKIKDDVQKFNTALTRQDNVNFNNLFKISTLNKTQKAHFDKYTANFKTSIKVTKESMGFYLEDLNDLIADKELSADEKSKQAEDILARARNDYRELIAASDVYLRNCSYAMPTLTYQKFLKAFEQNYFLGDLDMSEFSTMSTIKK
ncbi:hypothetical protein IKQ26_03700 [bacterium]|nr:hypothetical protein [bacterium]